MSDFLVTDGFGNLSNGTHTAGVTREILGEQWASYTNDFSLADIGDGRKWLSNPGIKQPIYLQTGSFSDQTTIFIAFLIYRTTGEWVNVAHFFDGVSLMGTLGFNTSGQLVYSTQYQGRLDTGVVASSSTIPVNTETHFEIKIVFHGSAGSVTFYINGVEDSATTGIDTINAGSACDSINFWSYGYPNANSYGFPAGGWKFTDMVVHAGAAAKGQMVVRYIPPDGDGSDTDFTPSAGTNYQCVDEIGPDEDATYNESDGTSGHRDSFTNGGISGLTILTVQNLFRAKRTEAGSAIMKGVSVHAAVEDFGANKGLSDSHLTYSDYFDDCPSTAAAWTTAQVGAAEFGYEVV